MKKEAPVVQEQSALPPIAKNASNKQLSNKKIVVEDDPPAQESARSRQKKREVVDSAPVEAPVKVSVDISETDATTAASTDPPSSSRGKKEKSSSSIDHKKDRDDASRASNAKSAYTKGGKKHPPQQDPVVEDLADDNVSDVSGSEDLEPVEVLQQYIPYYGQGDPANDSIVRSALSGLSVEDIDSKDEYGNTLLLLACQYRCEDLVRIMLNKGADPNAVNASGACCLHFACYRDSSSYNIAKILLQNGANPDIAETTYGCTPLHYCAGNGDLQFCKLLLSYGAQVNTFDYYNYTCVDYAREGSYTDVIDFLQKKLDQVNARQGGGGGGGSGGGNGLGSANAGHNGSFGRTSSMRMSVSGGTGTATGSGYDDISQWEVHTDPETGGKYYIHGKTGECLWEAELKTRMQQYQAAQWAAKANVASPGGNSSFNMRSSMTPNTQQQQQQQQELLAQAMKTQLVAVLAKFDPKRLLTLDALLAEYKDREQQLYDQLAREYAVEKDAEFEALLQKMKDASQGKAVASAIAASVASPGAATGAAAPVGPAAIDPMVLHEMAQETRKKLEAQFEEERQTLKKAFDRQLEDEKVAYRAAMSEKEGHVVKLQGDVEALQRERDAARTTVAELEQRLRNVQSSGGEALVAVEKEMTAVQDERDRLRQQVAALEQALQIEKDKLVSLENTLANLTSGQEELVQREKQAAMERAEQQRQREEQHARALQEVEERGKQALLKVKSEMNAAKNEFIRQERELKDQHEAVKASKDREIETLRRELAERKAQFAQEISAANMKIEDLQRVCEEMTRRAEEAEAYQKLVQEEIAEAKVVQKYNAQLHKDLQREQLARKKLHNEMEDMKGKIRVYVRVRPFSMGERERGCTEAVVKDGKMSVLVRGIGGPDGKKVYDFDQVFGGTDGNAQTDIFKDTKHLMMSVIDGYNVCIFACTRALCSVSALSASLSVLTTSVSVCVCVCGCRWADGCGQVLHDDRLGRHRLVHQRAGRLRRAGGHHAARRRRALPPAQRAHGAGRIHRRGADVPAVPRRPRGPAEGQGGGEEEEERGGRRRGEGPAAEDHARRALTHGPRVHRRRRDDVRDDAGRSDAHLREGLIAAHDGVDADERGVVAVAPDLRPRREAEEPPLGPGLRRQAHPRRSGGIRTRRQIGRVGRAAEGGAVDQQVAVGAGRRHRRADVEPEPRAVPQPPADDAHVRLHRRQREDAHVRQHVAGRLQRAGVEQLVGLRESLQGHHQHGLGRAARRAGRAGRRSEERAREAEERRRRRRGWSARRRGGRARCGRSWRRCGGGARRGEPGAPRHGAAGPCPAAMSCFAVH